MNQKKPIKSIKESQAKSVTVICQLQDRHSPLLIDEAAAWRFIEYEAADLPDSSAVRAVAHYWHVQHQRNACLRGIGRRLRAMLKRWAENLNVREASNDR